ncbi:hypothetical protein [Paenibacillus sp. P46E]|uniref:hypothetical protein n=1 Tax=Paenibacillus sp. P46E TaxID=1349436 RepID=UPI000AB2AA41|nr:hypothetical protein [Paenibacillus sp. P46E]
MTDKNNQKKKSLDSQKHSLVGNYRQPIKGIVSAETQIYPLGIQNWAKNLYEEKK